MITPEELLEHWQGHRRTTRRIIEAFPEDKLFNYSIGGMRPFSELVREMLGIIMSGIRGVLTGEWKRMEKASDTYDPKTKEEILELWDKATDLLNELWPKIPLQRFHEQDVAYGLYEGPVHSFIFYWIDNEIHHRGQGYVYLRSLGIEPPAFWDRS